MINAPTHSLSETVDFKCIEGRCANQNRSAPRTEMSNNVPEWFCFFPLTPHAVHLPCGTGAHFPSAAARHFHKNILELEFLTCEVKKSPSRVGGSSDNYPSPWSWDLVLCMIWHIESAIQSPSPFRNEGRVAQVSLHDSVPDVTSPSERRP